MSNDARPHLRLSGGGIRQAVLAIVYGLIPKDKTSGQCHQVIYTTKQTTACQKHGVKEGRYHLRLGGGDIHQATVYGLIPRDKNTKASCQRHIRQLHIQAGNSMSDM